MKLALSMRATSPDAKACLGVMAYARTTGVTLRGGWLPAKLGYSGMGSCTAGQCRTVQLRPNFRPPGPYFLYRSMPFRWQPVSYAAMPFRLSRKSYTVPIPFRRKPKTYTGKGYTFNSRALKNLQCI